MAGEYALFAIPSTISFVMPAERSDLGYVIQKTTNLTSPDWIDLLGTISLGGGHTEVNAVDPVIDLQGFYRIKVILYNQY